MFEIITTKVCICIVAKFNENGQKKYVRKEITPSQGKKNPSVTFIISMYILTGE